MTLADSSRFAARPRPGLATAPAAGPAPDLQALHQARLPRPVLLYLLAVVIPIGMQAGPLALTTLRLLLMVLIIPLMIRLLAGRYGRVFLTDILFTLHILWAAVAMAVNNPAVVVQNMGSTGVEFLGGYLVGRAYIRTPEAFAALCRVMVIIVCCTAPLALYETVTGRPLLLELLRSLPGIRTPELNYQEGRFGLQRVQLGFAHPIHYGLFCSVALSLGFVGLQQIWGRTARFATGAVIVLCGFLALSSGALLAILLQLGLILWFWLFSATPRRWWLLFGLFALAYVMIDLLSTRTPLDVFMSYATFSAHTAYWRSIIFEWGMVNVWANPVFGIGLNDWVRPWYMHSGSMDNFWLVMAVRYGIPGFLLITLGYAWSVVLIMRRSFAGDAVLIRFRRAWIFTFLGLSFTLTTVHVWTNIYSFVFFLFGAGMWLITADPQPPPGRAAAGPADPDPAAAPPAPGRPALTRFPVVSGRRTTAAPRP